MNVLLAEIDLLGEVDPFNLSNSTPACKLIQNYMLVFLDSELNFNKHIETSYMKMVHIKQAQYFDPNPNY